ncbi:MAG: TraB/GumN family protein [bacterium]
MKKILLIVFLVISFTSQGQLLYRISGNGLQAPSYIVGTYHLAPSTFVDSIPGLRAAFAACKQVYGEVDMIETLKPENVAKMQEAMSLPEGKTLSSILNKEQMDRLNALMREIMGVDMNNEAVAEQLDKLSPMVLETQLTLLTYMKNVQFLDINDMIDTYFQREAIKEGKTVNGFETADFQMDVLYGAPLEEQVEGLMCFVDNYQDMVEMAEFITAAYFAQDLEQLEDLNKEEQEGACAGNSVENDKLIYDRNDNWVKAMPDIMSENPTLFVVGAFHLCGNRGVLRMLEEKGYNIESVRK